MIWNWSIGNWAPVDKVSRFPFVSTLSTNINSCFSLHLCVTARRRWPVLESTSARIHLEKVPLLKPSYDKGMTSLLIPSSTQHFTPLLCSTLVGKEAKYWNSTTCMQRSPLQGSRRPTPGLWVLLPSNLEADGCSDVLSVIHLWEKREFFCHCLPLPPV